MSKAGMGMSTGTNVVHKGTIDPSQNCVDSTRDVHTGLIDRPARNSPRTSAETPEPILGGAWASGSFRKATDTMGLSRGKAEKLVHWLLRLVPCCHSSPHKAKDIFAGLVKLPLEINRENFGLNSCTR